MDNLIKHAIKRNSTEFINEFKSMLADKYKDVKQNIKNNLFNEESPTQMFANLGIPGFIPGVDYVIDGKTFTVVKPEIADNIEKYLKSNGTEYNRSGMNFIITAM